MHDHPSVPEAAGPSHLPLTGIRVIEFTHMVMGPTCGMVLADLGADVIKVEPSPSGDNSRRLTGPALGFFPTFNRNKRSVCVDLKSEAGRGFVRQLARTADVIVENFRPGAMAKLGLGYEQLAEENSRLIYCACKGFLPGPYEHRTALDEVVQMMGGLAYMTGPPGRPLRAGASVNDIMGGVFGAVAILAALRRRDLTGQGGLVQSGLFETNMMFVAQHMSYAAIEGKDLLPFGDPKLGRPWPVYDIFETDEPGQQVFLGVVTESQWRSFCEAFDLGALLSDASLATPHQRTANRPRILSQIAEIFRTKSKAELMRRFEALGLPFAPVAKPSDLFDDPHLNGSGGLLPIDLSTAEAASQGEPITPVAQLPALPIAMPEGRLGLTRQPPRAGEHTAEVARELGFTEAEISQLLGRPAPGADAAPGQSVAQPA